MNIYSEFVFVFLIVSVDGFIEFALSSEICLFHYRLHMKRKQLPKLVYTLLSDKDLRKRLIDVGLPTAGNRKVKSFFLVLFQSQGLPDVKVLSYLSCMQKCRQINV